ESNDAAPPPCHDPDPVPRGGDAMTAPNNTSPLLPQDQEQASATTRDPFAAAPTTPVSGLFMVRYTLAYFGMWVALMTPISLTLGVRAKQVSPDGAAEILSLVLGVGSAVAVICNPFFGKLSDRTRSRFGMRRPWRVGGALRGSLGLALVAFAPSVPVLVLGWVLTQGSFNAVLGALTAMLADQVPSVQRGKVSGLMGLCGPLAIVSGTFVATLVDHSVVLMFLVPAAIGLIALVAFALTTQDRRLHPDHELPPYRLGECLRSFWVNPLRHQDYGWAWFSRLFMNWGYATGMSYQVLFLTDGLGFELAAIAGLVFLATTALQVTAVIFSGFGGWLSDRIGSRKKIVAVAAGFLAAGLAVVAFADSFPIFLIGVTIAGIGQGLYVAIELAIVAEVVTEETAAARDFGVSNIGNTLPQTLVPTVAPLVLALPLLGND